MAGTDGVAGDKEKEDIDNEEEEVRENGGGYGM